MVQCSVPLQLASLCFRYSVTIESAKKEIESLQRNLTDDKYVFEFIKELLDGGDKAMRAITH